MDNFSYFHLCDHNIKQPIDQGQKVTILVNSSGGPVDIVINGATILQVLEVRAVEYDPNVVAISDFYYDNTDVDPSQTYDSTDDSDSYYDDQAAYLVNYGQYFEKGATVSDLLPGGYYEPFLHNRLKWSVKPPVTYQVTAIVRYSGSQYKRYVDGDCPVCGGKGWFVDLLTKDGTFLQPEGVVKVAQRVVKDLLTELGTSILDINYGQTLRDDMVNYAKDEGQMFNLIQLAVSNVEDNYLNEQQMIITTLQSDEIMVSITVDSIARSPYKNTTIILQLRITTQTEDQVLQVGF